MSGKRKLLSLADLARQSHVILEVRKRSPYGTQESIPLGTKSGKAFQGSAYAFEVVSIVKTRDGTTVPKAIKVHYANDLPNYFETRRQEEQKGHKILFYPYYEPETPGVDTLPEFLVFLKHEDRLDRFFFTAAGAIESKEKAEQVRALLRPVPK